MQGVTSEDKERGSDLVEHAQAERLVVDDFEDDLPPGQVIGSRTPSGMLRSGRDVESRLSVDHGALRIAAPKVPGRARHLLTYGPLTCSCGLVFAAYVQNGHNASRTAALDEHRPVLDAMRRLFWQGKRFARDLVDQVGLARRSQPAVMRPAHYAWPEILDNLAVGWFSPQQHRLRNGPQHGFVVRSADGDCGELHVMCQGRSMPVLHGLQNVPVLYVVHVREAGATYYACSLGNVPGLPAFPALRPIAIDPSGDAIEAVAGIDQRVLGEIRFSNDTRVYGTRIASVPQWTAWYGSAHAADKLTGAGGLSAEAAEQGGSWRTSHASAKRGPEGTTMHGRSPAASELAIAALDPGCPSGLVHVWLEASSEDGCGGLWFRGDADRGVAVLLGPRDVSLVETDGTRCRVYARDRTASMRRGRRHSLLVMDDGERLSFALDGRRILQSAPALGHPDTSRVGLVTCGRGAMRFADFEAHPRQVALPTALRSSSPWWEPPASARVVSGDAFSGPGGDLAAMTRGGLTWRRVLGRGVIEADGQGGARVQASPARPNPGRTLYTIPWPRTALADFEVEMTLPGTRQGQGQLGRGGLVIWQDADHYLVVNAWNDDTFPGASVSSFLTYGGQEQLYRAVWTNVGPRIRRGVPFRMRMISDGHHYRVLIDDEPVLQRAITDIEPSASPLHIHQLGLAVNWEFGDDTGTVFRRFFARGD